MLLTRSTAHENSENSSTSCIEIAHIVLQHTCCLYLSTGSYLVPESVCTEALRGATHRNLRCSAIAGLELRHDIQHVPFEVRSELVSQSAGVGPAEAGNLFSVCMKMWGAKAV